MSSKLLAVMLAASGLAGSALAQDRYAERRDLVRDNATAARLRADIARDQYRLNEDLRTGRRRDADAVRRDLARDQRALRALERDMRRDRNQLRYDRGYR